MNKDFKEAMQAKVIEIYGKPPEPIKSQNVFDENYHRYCDSVMDFEVGWNACYTYLQKEGGKDVASDIIEPERKFYCKEYDSVGYACEEQCRACNKAENAPDLEPEHDPNEINSCNYCGGLIHWSVKFCDEQCKAAYDERYKDRESEQREAVEKPRVVCFCGSTRFTEWFMVKRWELEKQGIITLGINILPREGHHFAEQEGVKHILDQLHKRKIDLSDEVFILNVGGYIGESTRSELEYAKSIGKPVIYLEPYEP